MSIIFHTIRKAAYISLGLTSRVLQLSQQRCIVFCYHSIGDGDWPFEVSEEIFKQQIIYLSKRYQFVGLNDIADCVNNQKILTKPSVAITFDDGYQSILKIRDFLDQKNIKPTVFLLSNPQNANRKELGTKTKLLNNAQILSLIKSGWEIGCHTATHPDMHTLSSQQIKQEIIYSKTSLEKRHAVPVNYFAYPKGKYNSEILQGVKKAGYRIALTVQDGQINSQTNRFLVPRIGVDRHHGLLEYKYLSARLVIKFRQIMRSIGIVI